MRYHLLACDYDGTLATDGRVGDASIGALRRLQASGRQLALVTGRELDDIRRVFPQIDLFERVVAENGGVLFNPSTREIRPLAPPPDERFVDLLRRRGVQPLSVGRTIVATWEPNEKAVLDAIRDLGLELEVIFNKGAVMVLPAGVTKASGLAAALEDLHLSFHNAVGIGDAENDHAFISACEASVVVANALPSLKDRADLITEGTHGAGVAELIDRLIADDLADLEPHLTRHRVVLGKSADGEISVEPYGEDLLVAGPSGSGKSSLVAGVLERFADAGYQFCLVDPEGDYERLERAILLGDTARAPTIPEALEVLGKPGESLILNLVAVPIDERPGFFERLLPQIQELRSRFGHPHWLVIDEAHHLIPATRSVTPLPIPVDREGTLLITVHPDRVAASALDAVELVVAVGDNPSGTLGSFLEGLRAGGKRAGTPPRIDGRLDPGWAVAWAPGTERPPIPFEAAPARTERSRHRRKYAAGELPSERSFFFRGPDGKLNLQAQNLQLFVQLGEGVDDATWTYHLARGDYSRWMRDMIKDGELADRVAEIERSGGPAAETRAAIKKVVEERYTAAA